MKYIIALALILIQANAISFYVKEGKEKCFSDEIPSRQVDIIYLMKVVIVYHELLTKEVPEAEKDNEQKEKLLTHGLEFRVYDPNNVIF